MCRGWTEKQKQLTLAFSRTALDANLPVLTNTGKLCNLAREGLRNHDGIELATRQKKKESSAAVRPSCELTAAHLLEYKATKRWNKTAEKKSAICAQQNLALDMFRFLF